MALSAPNPCVRSRTASIGSTSLELMISSTPKSSPRVRRFLLMSIRMIRDAPRNLLRMDRNMPTGPAPRIATVSPSLTLMFSTHEYADDRGSAKLARTGEILSGTRNVAPRSTRLLVYEMYSAKPPGRPT